MLAIKNCEASGPLTVTPIGPAEALPVFVNVNGCAALSVPTVTDPKSLLVGVTTSVLVTPFPESVAAAITPLPEKARVAAFAPDVVGCISIDTMHVPPAGKVEIGRASRRERV